MIKKLFNWLKAKPRQVILYNTGYAAIKDVSKEGLVLAIWPSFYVKLAPNGKVWKNPTAKDEQDKYWSILSWEEIPE